SLFQSSTSSQGIKPHLFQIGQDLLEPPEMARARCWLIRQSCQKRTLYCCRLAVLCKLLGKVVEQALFISHEGGSLTIAEFHRGCGESGKVEKVVLLELSLELLESLLVVLIKLRVALESVAVSICGLVVWRSLLEMDSVLWHSLLEMDLVVHVACLLFLASEPERGERQRPLSILEGALLRLSRRHLLWL
ncbi:hypothetical protein CEP52_017461, partial [Fusarium oligoseptatum]